MARTITFVGPPDEGKLSSRTWVARDQVRAVQLLQGIANSDEALEGEGLAILVRLAGNPSDVMVAIAVADQDSTGARQRMVAHFESVIRIVSNDDEHVEIDFKDLSGP